MTLDEAIKHCEEVAERHDRIKQIKAVTLEECKCAEEHRKLATWLRELKQLREQMSHSEKPDKWIPATTLPEKDGEYLLFGKIDETEENHIFIGEYDSGSEDFGIWEEQFDSSTLGCLGSEFYEYASVLAWMPLPNAYKESEDKK